MSQPCALIVDDEPDILELLAITLERMDVGVCRANNLAEAMQVLRESSVNLCLTDMRLGDGDGIDLVRHIQDRYPNIPVAMITAHGNMEAAVEALKLGAFDFVSKPVDLEVLRNLVATALRLAPVDAQERTELMGSSQVMDETRAIIRKVARSQAPVHITGESGTGKELAARMVHASSPRAAGPFVPVNCGAIPADLVESELFGHKKGSFTGAVSDHAGLFLAAAGGTLFLDEVGELPLAMQVKLLRAIQEKQVRPVGGAEEVPVDVRIISATHKDLAEMVDAGTFRQDLYFRINVITIRMPPLRERRGDIPEHIERMLQALSPGHTVSPDEEAMQVLQQYAYPGNVRELENILERALALCEEDCIRKEDLGLDLSAAAAQPPASMEDSGDLSSYMDEIERKRIIEALQATGGNKTAAAKHLGISFRALRYRLDKLGLS